MVCTVLLSNHFATSQHIRHYHQFQIQAVGILLSDVSKRFTCVGIQYIMLLCVVPSQYTFHHFSNIEVVSYFGFNRLKETWCIHLPSLVWFNLIALEVKPARFYFLSHYLQSRINFANSPTSEYSWLSVGTRGMLETHVNAGLRHPCQFSQPHQFQVVVSKKLIKLILCNLFFLFIHNV